MDYKYYFKALKPFIIFAVFFFVLSFVYGYFGAQAAPNEARAAIDDFKEMFSPILDVHPLAQFFLVFVNNAFSLFWIIILGFIFGIMPLLALFSNGALLGVFAFFLQAEGQTGKFLAGIIPHGIVELPLIIIGAAIGLRIGRLALDKVMAKIFPKKKNKLRISLLSIKSQIIVALIFFIKILLPLVGVAAAIEVFITPLLI